MSTERDDTSYTAPYCSSAMIEAACKLRLSIGCSSGALVGMRPGAIRFRRLDSESLASYSHCGQRRLQSSHLPELVEGQILLHHGPL